ncbi:hypothetical protein IRJ34_16055 [Paenarthrobacter sp. GOM3]|uniref:hypothetical protein n=1 Tax=Paenarthrobacter sp. GOM3 TaxID=2782567 RepID=UPI001BA44443|nr:hypothetical protein [Paenarthrobacter sp. GOM3]WOH17848.1 hypothetical protein IRJ34_16055 [Paenarthrobacter sp. GOM3]
MDERFDAAAVAHRAQEIIDAGEQGEAQLLLRQALEGCQPARNVTEAVAIATMTRLLITLDAGLLPLEVLAGHVGRMHLLTTGFDTAGVAEACALAELQQFEWVHEQVNPDPVVLVDVLRGASSFADSALEARYPGVRQAGAEAALTAQMIRNWLDQDPLSIAVALESLALALTGGETDRIRHIRIDALLKAARLRMQHGSTQDDVGFLLHTVVTEATNLPSARSLLYTATICIADLALAEGVPADEALRAAYDALHVEFAGTEDQAALHCRHLDELLKRLPPGEHEHAAAKEWVRLADRYAASGVPKARNEFLSQIRYRLGSDGQEAGLRILRHADAAFMSDTDPETALERFLLGARVVELLGAPVSSDSPGKPQSNPSLAVTLSAELEHRFHPALDHPQLAVPMARLLLERALRLSDLDRLEGAQTVLASMRSHCASSPEKGLRHLDAQAAYWQSRFHREAGHRNEAAKAVNAVVAEFASDPDPDVRVWAANTLFSAWRDSSLTPAETAALHQAFADHFNADSDVRIRRLEASRRLTAAVNANDQGTVARAVELLNELVAEYGEDDDADIVRTVGLARENLTVLSLARAGDGQASTERQAEYRALRERLYASDEAYESGNRDFAEQEWRNIADAVSGTADPHFALLGLAALDAWAGHLTESGRWPELIDVARRAMVMDDGMDFRAKRIRARAHLRLGIAQGRLSDPLSAIASYEALDAMARGSGDDEIATIREQAAYNRAVLIDDLGDARAALIAYDHALAVHGDSTDSPNRRLRCIKALRNKVLLLENFGLLAEAAGAHKQILDIASRAPGPEVNERGRLSAFGLAECFARLGDHASARQAYEWIQANPWLGFTPVDLKAAKRGMKFAKRQS